jgi:class 3 adenylate cyclase
MSATPDSTLANLEQRIADLERGLAECQAERDEAQQQLAERTSERDEAHAQQTATAEVLKVINISPGELKPVFDAILDKAHSLCGAEYGVLLTYDGELFWRAAVHGFPETRWREGIRPGFGYRRLVRGERFLHIHERRSRLVENGVRTTLAVPLRKDGKLLGIITANRREVRPFSDNQIALLESSAAQAVIAMENARLLTETREALEQQTATAEVLGVINSSPGDLQPVFDAMLEKALQLCGASFGSLQTYEGEYFEVVAAKGDPRFVERVRSLGRLSMSRGVTQQRIADGARVIHLVDILEDPVYLAGNPSLHATVEQAGVRTLLTIALRKEDEVLGQISIYRREVRPFTDKQIALLQNFAEQAVIATENARLLDELHQRTDQVAELNRGLEARVAEQVEELGRVGRLKRFLAPQLAELIVSQGDEKILESHRREIVVVFCDLRGYTAFTETAEPEDALDFLREYHGTLGPLVSQFEGTLDHFAGDGIMVFFNDPVPCPDPAERAVKMAMAMREAAGKLINVWRRRLGSELGFGAGIAQGYATLGQIGFSDRSGYTATGTVCNLAARLCAEAKDGQILVSSRIAEAVEAVAKLEDLGNVELKGLRSPVAAFNVAQSTSAADVRPNLTVVASGPEA